MEYVVLESRSAAHLADSILVICSNPNAKSITRQYPKFRPQDYLRCITIRYPPAWLNVRINREQNWYQKVYYSSWILTGHVVTRYAIDPAEFRYYYGLIMKCKRHERYAWMLLRCETFCILDVLHFVWLQTKMITCKLYNFLFVKSLPIIWNIERIFLRGFSIWYISTRTAIMVEEFFFSYN